MSDAGKWLAGSVPFAAAVFGFLGVTDGEVTRILANYPVRFLIAFVLILLAAALGAWAPALPRTAAKLGSLVVGFLMLIVGLTLMTHLAGKSATDNERPRISTTLTEGAEGPDVLTAEVVGAGLRVEEHLIVTVTGRGDAGSKEVLLYGARVGPDETGRVGHSLKLPVDTASYGAVDVQAQFVLRGEKEEDQSLEMLATGETANEKAAGKTADEKGCNEESRDLACVTVFNAAAR